MPFDPTKPATNSPNSSAEMRAQLIALNAEIQLRATQADLAAVVAGSSANCDAVGLLGQTADAGYNQTQMQDVLNKLDELIAALRR